jgi:hypothetical protein
MATKNYYFSYVFAYYFLKLHLHHFSVIKKSQDSTGRNSKFFLVFLLDDRRIRSWIVRNLVLMDPETDPGGPKTYGSGSATLDLRHSYIDLFRFTGICSLLGCDEKGIPSRDLCAYLALA